MLFSISLFDHAPVGEGDTIEIEDMELTVLETGGHTPEHVTGLHNK